MASEDAPKKKGKGKLIGMVVVIVLIGGFAAKTVLLKPAPKTPQQLAAEKAAKTEATEAFCAVNNDMPVPKGATPPTTSGTTADAPVLELDSITINLADSHFLKIGLALALPVGTVVQTAKDNGVGAEATNLVIDRLSGQTMSALMTGNARAQLRKQIGYDTCMQYDGKVLTVFFTDFVMQ